jgi:phospholipid-transporting ATPase
MARLKNLELREIIINETYSSANSLYAGNKLQFSRYTLATFLPKNLFEQFQRVSNIWFLVISIFQLLPYHLNPTDSWTNIAPLSILLFIALVKDGYTYYSLSKKLKVRNNAVYKCWNGEYYFQIKSEDIAVGQFIEVEEGSYIPADMIFVGQKTEGRAFLDMTSLLGITSIVEKKYIEKLNQYIYTYDSENLNIFKINGKVGLREPNPDYGNFYATIKLENFPSAFEVMTENVLFSGGILKGTGPIMGFVVYCGVDSKMHLNISPSRRKISKIEQTVNKWVLYILSILFLLVLGSVIGYYNSSANILKSHSVLEPIITFILLYNNIIPISMFIVLDIIKLLQSIIFSHNNPEIAFNTEIVNEDLGQVEILLTDKTTALTDGKLKVKACVIDNRKFFLTEDETEVLSNLSDNTNYNLQASPLINSSTLCTFSMFKNYFNPSNSVQEFKSSPESEFFKAMVLCGNLYQNNNEYMGAQEDIAIVEAAAKLGYVLKIIDLKVYEIELTDIMYEYKIICSKPFNKERKRSRIILKDRLSGIGALYVKGSCKGMIPLLGVDPAQAEEIKNNVQDLKSKGYKCIVIGYKRIKKGHLADFISKIKKIRKSLVNTEGRIENLLRDIEKNLNYIGIVALSEDILPGIPETVGNLKKSGIKVWMVSSDKSKISLTIAKNAGIIDEYTPMLDLKNIKSEHHCTKSLMKGIKNLIHNRMDSGVLRPSRSDLNLRRRGRKRLASNLLDPEEEDGGFSEFRPEISNNPIFKQYSNLDENVDILLNKPFEPYGINFCIMMDAHAFNIALNNDSCRKLLVCMLGCARSVVFSNFIPRDKGNLIRLLKENIRYKPLIVAIGTGEGDINMLQQSDIGIGIKTKDSFAMNYSDLVISKFNQLENLILVQGHYNYIHVSKVILLFLYKNFLFTIILVSYTFLCGYSGTSIFNISLMIGYNIFFTTLPIIIIGISNENISSVDIVEMMHVYSIGISNKMFNWKILVIYGVISSIQAAILIVFGFVCVPYIITTSGFTDDLITLGTSSYIILIVTVLVHISIEAISISYKYGLSVFFSISFLVIFLSIESNTKFPNSDLQGIGDILSNAPALLISMFISPIICVIPTYFILKYYKLFTNQILRTSRKHSLLNYDNSKIISYQECLSKLYKYSDTWKSKILHQKFSLKKFILQFTMPYVEKKYSEIFIKENLTMIKFTFCILWMLLLLLTIIGAALTNIDVAYTLARTFLLIASIPFIFLLWTEHFTRYYKFYVCMAALLGLLSKFGLEINFQRTSQLATSIASSVLFLVLNVKWGYICLLNLLNLGLFIISLSTQVSLNSTSPDLETYNLVSTFVLVISITITSGIIGYYYELSRRTEHELINISHAEIEKTQSILKIMLPEFVRNRVKEGVRYIAESQGDVTILFCDICEFDNICKEYHHYELTSFLDKLFSSFDQFCNMTGTTKIETVGKTYMACAGLRDSDKEISIHLKNENHARRAVELAFAMIQEVSHIQLKNGSYLKVKIGLNSGPVSAGVVGYHKPQFSLVGDTVNTASRMCSTLDSYNSIQISSSTYNHLKRYRDYEFAPRNIYAKGKGDIVAYIVTDTTSSTNEDSAINLPGKSSFGSKFSYGSDRSILDSAPKKNEPIKSFPMSKMKSWKSNVLKVADPDLISYTPSIRVFDKSPNSQEQKFRIERLEKKSYPVMVSLIVGVTTYGILLLISALQYAFTSTYLNCSVVIVRAFVFVGYIILTIAFKKIFVYKIYSFFIKFLILIGLTITMLNLVYSNLEADFIGLEIMYILILSFHVTHSKIVRTLILILVLIIPWTILAVIYSNDLILHITDVLLVAGLGFINLKTIYSQEKSERKKFNLNILAKKEIKTSGALLSQMMPPHVLKNLEKGKAFTDRLINVTMIFADIVGFTDWSSHKTPNEVVEMLYNLFTKFDKLCVELDVYKVHTIGDCYVVMGDTGRQRRNFALESLNVLKMAYRMIDIIKEENEIHNSTLNMRIGMHTGEIIAGVIGTNIVRYDVWGPDVLIANKMESNGEPGRIKVSKDTKKMLESIASTTLRFEKSKKVEINAIGVIKSTYFVECDSKSELNSIIVT